MAQALQAVQLRSQARIAELEALLRRIADYEASHQDELSGRADYRADDPRFSGHGS